MNWLSTRADWQLLGGLILVLLIFRAWLTQAAGFDLHFDEAQYWEWSQQLDWSYYSKGPLVAWLIALAESLFGHGEWQVRLFAWLCHGLFLVILFYFALSVWHNRAVAWWAVIIALCTPVYFTLGLVMTTDIFMFTCWAWGLWAAFRALFRDQRLAWYELGAAVGIGALTKLSIGLLPFFIGLLTLLTPQLRYHLKNPHLWVALLLMVFCMSPLLIWNAQNDWVMLLHERGHVTHDAWSLQRSGEFLLGQWAVLSPVVVVIALLSLWRMPQPMEQRFLWLIGLACIGFFIIKAGSAKVQLNWPAPAYIGLIILFAGHIPSFSATKRGVLIAGILVSIILLSVAYFPSVYGLSAKQDPFKVTKHWRQAITEISTLPAAQDIDFILTHNYKLAGELAFYWPQRIPVYITGNAKRRFTQHDLWPSIDREAGRDGLYISKYPDPPDELKQAFAHCTPREPVAARAVDGHILRTLYVWRCDTYQPIVWPKPASY